MAHPAHLGGAVAGWLFLRLQVLSRRAPVEPARSVERVVMVQSGAAEEPERRVAPTPVASAAAPHDGCHRYAELDRVLDKISATGIASLTPAERRFLDEMSRRKQRGRALNLPRASCAMRAASLTMARADQSSP